MPNSNDMDLDIESNQKYDSNISSSNFIAKDRKLNDIFFLIIFAIQLVAVISFSIYSMFKVEDIEIEVNYVVNSVYIFLFAILYILIIIFIILKYPKFLIYIAATISLILSVAYLVGLIFSNMKLTMKILLFLFGLFLLIVYMVYFIKNRKIITFYTKLSSKIIKKNSKIFIYAFSFNVVLVLIGVCFLYSVYYIYAVEYSKSKGMSIFYYFLLVLSFMWTIGFFFYYFASILALIVCNYLFNSRNPYENVHSSFKTITKFSLGSISLGTLITVLLTIIIQIIQIILYNVNEYLGCISEIILQTVENFVEMLRDYSFVEMAKSGKTFFKSLKVAFKKMKKTSVIFNYFLFQFIFSSIAIFGIFISVIMFGLLFKNFGYVSVVTIIAFSSIATPYIQLFIGITIAVVYYISTEKDSLFQTRPELLEKLNNLR